MGMKNEKKGFFSRMLSSEHKVFETSMFGISVVLTLALVIGIGYYISVAFLIIIRLQMKRLMLLLYRTVLLR